MGSRDRLIKELQKIKLRSSGSRIGRFLYHPARYIIAIFCRHVSYPILKKGLLKKAKLFFGEEMTVLLPAGTDLYLLGAKAHDSELRLAAYLINTIEPGDLIVDIGAHFGFFSILSAYLTENKGKVIAIEPSSETVRLLKQNTNRWKQIEIKQLAVGESDGEIAFYEFPLLYSEYNSYQTSQYSTQNWFKALKSKPVNVQLATLDSLKLSDVRLIKIDAEGSEDKVISGAHFLLTEQQPIVIMEYLTGANHGNSHREALDLMLNMGYDVNVSDMEGKLITIEHVDNYMAAQGLDSENIIFTKRTKEEIH
jgi:FkbM family methyltransferase